MFWLFHFVAQEFSDKSESHQEFARLYQNLQIRTSSEVNKKSLKKCKKI